MNFWPCQAIRGSCCCSQQKPIMTSCPVATVMGRERVLRVNSTNLDTDWLVAVSVLSLTNRAAINGPDLQRLLKLTCEQLDSDNGCLVNKRPHCIGVNCGWNRHGLNTIIKLLQENKMVPSMLLHFWLVCLAAYSLRDRIQMVSSGSSQLLISPSFSLSTS